MPIRGMIQIDPNAPTTPSMRRSPPRPPS